MLKELLEEKKIRDKNSDLYKGGKSFAQEIIEDKNQSFFTIFKFKGRKNIYK